MIYNEDAYGTVYFRNVRELKAGPALVFCAICGLLQDPKNTTGEIATKTLCELLNFSKNTVKEAVDKLVAVGYIEVVAESGSGRGNKSVYSVTKKGSENAPFTEKKRVKNSSEKGQNLTEKGSEIDPLNEVLKKELKESGDVVRETNDNPTLTTPQDFETMENFNLFWALYPGDPQWSHEKENCERVWHAMQESWRENLVKQLQEGKRWRERENDNPYWYLKNYNGEVIAAELPIMRQGTSACTKWLNEHQRKGDTICVIRYEGKCVYCLEPDRAVVEAAGGVWLTNMKIRTDD